MTVSETTSFTGFGPSLSGDYQIDPSHSRMGFVARHAMVSKVRGGFNDFEGSIHIDVDDPSKSSASLTIKTTSVDTRNEQRDAHLRTNDFFDAPTHPEISFKSTGVKVTDPTHVEVTGDLTIRGVTKEVSLSFEFLGAAKDPYGYERIGFEGSTVINRTDFGVNFNAILEAGGVMVSEKITLEIEVEAIKQG